MTPALQGEINGAIFRVKKAFGVPQETGVVSYARELVRQAEHAPEAERKVLLKKAAQMDKAIFDEMLKQREITPPEGTPAPKPPQEPILAGPPAETGIVAPKGSPTIAPVAPIAVAAPEIPLEPLKTPSRPEFAIGKDRYIEESPGVVRGIGPLGPMSTPTAVRKGGEWYFYGSKNPVPAGELRDNLMKLEPAKAPVLPEIPAPVMERLNAVGRVGFSRAPAEAGLKDESEVVKAAADKYTQVLQEKGQEAADAMLLNTEKALGLVGEIQKLPEPATPEQSPEAGKRPKPIGKPKTFSQWVRMRGGINPDKAESSDILELDDTTLINRKRGMSLDGMVEAAAEDGWIPRGSTGSDVIEKLVMDKLKPQYHPAEMEYVGEQQPIESMDARMVNQEIARLRQLSFQQPQGRLLKKDTERLFEALEHKDMLEQNQHEQEMSFTPEEYESGMAEGKASYKTVNKTIEKAKQHDIGTAFGEPRISENQEQFLLPGMPKSSLPSKGLGGKKSQVPAGDLLKGFEVPKEVQTDFLKSTPEPIRDNPITTKIVQDGFVETTSLDASDPANVAATFFHLKNEKVENYWIEALDENGNLLGVAHLGTGIIDQAIVDPLDTMDIALRMGAKRIIIVHNHPSGDVSASKPDLNLTTRLAQAGRDLGVRVESHVIINHGKFGLIGRQGDVFRFQEVPFTEPQARPVQVPKFKIVQEGKGSFSGRKVGNPQSAASISKEIQDKNTNTVFGIILNVRNEVNGIAPLFSGVPTVEDLKRPIFDAMTAHNGFRMILTNGKPLPPEVVKGVRDWLRLLNRDLLDSVAQEKSDQGYFSMAESSPGIFAKEEKSEYKRTSEEEKEKQQSKFNETLFSELADAVKAKIVGKTEDYGLKEFLDIKPDDLMQALSLKDISREKLGDFVKAVRNAIYSLELPQNFLYAYPETRPVAEGVIDAHAKLLKEQYMIDTFFETAKRVKNKTALSEIVVEADRDNKVNLFAELSKAVKSGKISQEDRLAFVNGYYFMQKFVKERLIEDILASRLGIRLKSKGTRHLVSYETVAGEAREKWVTQNQLENLQKKNKSVRVLDSKEEVILRHADPETGQYVSKTEKVDDYEDALKLLKQEEQNLVRQILPYRNYVPHARRNGKYWVQAWDVTADGAEQKIFAARVPTKHHAEFIESEIKKQMPVLRTSVSEHSSKMNVMPSFGTMADVQFFLNQNGIDPNSEAGKRIMNAYRSMSPLMSSLIHSENITGWRTDWDGIVDSMYQMAKSATFRSHRLDIKDLMDLTKPIKDDFRFNTAVKYIQALTEVSPKSPVFDGVKAVTYFWLLANKATYVAQNLTEPVWALARANPKSVGGFIAPLSEDYQALVRRAQKEGLLRPFFVEHVGGEGMFKSLMNLDVLGRMSESHSSKKVFEIGLRLARDRGLTGDKAYDFAVQFFYEKGKPFYHNANKPIFLLGPEWAAVRKYGFTLANWTMDFFGKFFRGGGGEKVKTVLAWIILAGVGSLPYGRKLLEGMGSRATKKSVRDLDMMDRFLLGGIAGVFGVSPAFLVPKIVSGGYYSKAGGDLGSILRGVQIIASQVNRAASAYGKYGSPGIVGVLPIGGAQYLVSGQQKVQHGFKEGKKTFFRPRTAAEKAITLMGFQPLAVGEYYERKKK